MSPPIITAIFLMSLLVTALLGLIVLASRHKKRAAGRLHLIGAIARVETDLRPEGAVLVGGELWQARTSDEREVILRGSRARVVGARGHLLEVERAVAGQE